MKVNVIFYITLFPLGFVATPAVSETDDAIRENGFR